MGPSCDALPCRDCERRESELRACRVEIDGLRAQAARDRAMVDAMAERIDVMRELLARRAERTTTEV